MEATEQPQALNSNGKKVVLIVHDETIIYANDASKCTWVLADSEGTLRPKSNGSSIMISGFLCECHGFVKLPPENGNPEYCSYTIIRPGENLDGYWKNSDLCEQLQSTIIPLAEKLHNPAEYDLVFAFYNSQNHHAMKDDALLASSLNKTDGGKNTPKLRNTQFIHNITHELVLQNMQTEEGLQKGVNNILIERGLWVHGMKLDEAREMLSAQPDFASQREWLKEVVENAGHTILYFPKFHCELNFIEMAWSYVKSYYRRQCTFEFNKLLESIDEILTQKLTVNYIRKYSRHCYRFMDGYRLNMHRPLLDFAMKKHSKHRSFPNESTIEAITSDYEKYKDSLKKKDLKL
jgi:transposase